MHRWRLVFVALVGALALSGCLRFSTELTLAPDNTISGQFVVAVKQGTGDDYAMSDRDLARDLWAEYPKADALADATYSDYDKDGYVGVTVSFSDAPLTTFEPAATDWGVQRLGDEFVVSGPSNAVTKAAQNELPEGSAVSELGDAQFTVSVTFPGAVSEHNGSLVNRTVTWHLQDAPPELSARGSASAEPDRATPLAWFAVAVIVVGGLAYGLAGRIARRKP
ncbi:hypothetical protein [Demequina sp.]|uniref:LppM family (lipo)protein n=1 Tax=Demequina sp. TaxID=2050685 RepID=UPI0025C1B852|nr:hypothetical protein [Demequina sp.]